MDFKEGIKIQAIRKFKTTGLVHFSAPFTGGFKCEIEVGTNFIILGGNDDRPGFYVIPELEKEFESEFVSLKDRESEVYGGYSLVFMKSDLGDKYDFVHES